jgi:DNA-binding protein H-NS
MAWEYYELDLTNVPKRQSELDLLNRAGQQGWELIALLPPHRALMRRPLEKAGEHEETQVPAKYRDPVTGATWSGRGRMANWLAQKVQAGEAAETYLVKG